MFSSRSTLLIIFVISVFVVSLSSSQAKQETPKQRINEVYKSAKASSVDRFGKYVTKKFSEKDLRKYVNENLSNKRDIILVRKPEQLLRREDSKQKVALVKWGTNSNHLRLALRVGKINVLVLKVDDKESSYTFTERSYCPDNVICKN